jgi:hypothetical protein
VSTLPMIIADKERMKIAMADVVEKVIRALNIPLPPPRDAICRLIQLVEERPFMFFDVREKKIIKEGITIGVVTMIPRKNFSYFVAAYRAGEFCSSTVE